MSTNSPTDLYTEVIIEHNKKPRNFKVLAGATHQAEGYNPLCGDHLSIYLQVGKDNTIEDISFAGEGCAISKASASIMTLSLKGKKLTEAIKIFEQFHELIKGNLNPDKDQHSLGKLVIFKTIWHFPARVKCASLAWHTMKGALERIEKISTEE